MLYLFSCDRKSNNHDGLPQAGSILTHNSFSNRERNALCDSIPLEQKLIPPKHIDDLRNFQVVYCLDPYGDRDFLWYHNENFYFNGKIYEPSFMIAYRKSVIDTLAEMHDLAFLPYSKEEYEKDRTIYNRLKKDWNFDDSKKIRLYKDKLIDNGRTLKIEAVNYNEYYCYDNNVLMIYKFTNNIVYPIVLADGEILHLPYIFEDTR